jgi:hypothetical protein
MRVISLPSTEKEQTTVEVKPIMIITCKRGELDQTNTESNITILTWKISPTSKGKKKPRVPQTKL